MPKYLSTIFPPVSSIPFTGKKSTSQVKKENRDQITSRVLSACDYCLTPFLQVIGNGSIQKYCCPYCRNQAQRKRREKRVAEQQKIVESKMTDEERTRMTELEELVDGCYTIIELYKPESPSQVEWKKRWMEKAKRLVPSAPEW